MIALQHTAKIREYLDYVESHVRNVELVWQTINDKCGDMHPFYDDHLWNVMREMILEHDISKTSPEEFIQYQRQFYPVGDPPARDNPEFAAAWKHHLDHNPHHWEHWTKIEKEHFPNEMACHCVCMVVDWLAMSFLNDSAKDYYAKNKAKMNLPEWADKLVTEIFSRIYV